MTKPTYHCPVCTGCFAGCGVCTSISLCRCADKPRLPYPRDLVHGDACRVEGNQDTTTTSQEPLLSEPLLSYWPMELSKEEPRPEDGSKVEIICLEGSLGFPTDGCSRYVVRLLQGDEGEHFTVPRADLHPLHPLILLAREAP